MSRTDLLADVFTIIRNSIMIKRENVDIPAMSTMKAILAILKKEGYIDNFKEVEDKRQGMLRVYLKYTLGKSAIKGIRRISRPGLRVYVKRDKIPNVLRGKGLAILSTPKGIMSNKEAREAGMGGEVLCYVW